MKVFLKKLWERLSFNPFLYGMQQTKEFHEKTKEDIMNRIKLRQELGSGLYFQNGGGYLREAMDQLKEENEQFKK